MRIHTVFVGRGISAFPVHGTLMDHHRLIWQFGVVPLMYYLYGENVIIDVREDPQAGSEQLNRRPLKNHQPVARRTYAITENFHAGLEIPMAVTGAWEVPIDERCLSSGRKSMTLENAEETEFSDTASAVLEAAIAADDLFREFIATWHSVSAKIRQAILAIARERK